MSNNPINNASVKRRHVFINKAFQGRFIASIFLLILLSCLCSALLIYWLTGGDLQAQSQTAHANILNASERLGLTILIGNVVAIVIASTVAVVVAIYASHKIAGPLYRFEKICEQIGDGQLNTITTLRENDQLQPLAAAFTVMLEKLRTRKNQQQATIGLISAEIEALINDKSLGGEHHEMLERLATRLQQLKIDTL
jgi:methyl-accepting chemotaxis protein